MLICEVEMLPEDEDVSAEACAAAAEVADLLRSTLRLSDLMQGIQAGEEDATAVPQELEQLDPQHLSYWWVPHACRPVLLVGATRVQACPTGGCHMCAGLSYWWVPHACRPVLLVGATRVQACPTGGCHMRIGLSYWWVPHAYRPVLLVGATCVASASTIIGDLGPPMAHTHTLCRVQYILP